MPLDLLLLNFDPELYNFDYFQQEDVCRFCWKREELTKLIELPTNAIMKNGLMYKISECLDIDLSQCSQSHPKKICDECFSQITKFYEYKKFCKETDNRLREILNNREKISENDDKLIKIEIECDDTKDDSFKEYLECGEDSEDSDNECNSIDEQKPKWKYKPKKTPTYCYICRVDFENTKKFNSHNSKCHGIEKDGLFKCFGCERRFQNRKARLAHELRFCKGLLHGYKCDVCNRYLPKRRMYEAHMRDHRKNKTVQLPEEIFKCTKCDLLYKTKQMLLDHMFEHKNRKNYVCESCGRVFTRKDYLHKHKLTHTGEKQHECPHCAYRATHRSSLVMHIRRHTGERPFECSLCPQRCISSSNLRAHVQRHLGIKKHECEICNKKFGYKTSLQDHMLTHAPAQTHACELCPASYSRLSALKKHIAAKHADKEMVQ